jgi:MATE family multidrug resistance protein
MDGALSKPQRSEYRAVWRLGWPLALAQLGIMLTGVVDTVMVGWVSVEALAACSLANMYHWTFMSIGMGVVMGIDAQVSQAHGRGDGEAAGRALHRGVILAVLASVPVTIALLFTEESMLLLGQTPQIARLAYEYNVYKLPTTFCFLVYAAFKQFLQGREIVKPASFVMWSANVFNAFFNWVFIFGNLGVPAMGLQGAAIATTLTTASEPVLLYAIMKRYGLDEGARVAWDRASFELRPLLETFKLGFPIGLQMSLEASAFGLASFMSGWIDVTNIGAHQVVLNMASFAFMVPMGLAMGAATRVGNLIGEGDVHAMRRAVKASLALGALSMTVSALAFTTLRNVLPRMYSDDAALIALAAGILPLAGAFQLADGVQAMACGVLRGMGRPTVAAVINMLGYYAFALPLAYLMAFQGGLGLRGIWAGLALGVGTVAVALTFWTLRVAKLPLDALRVAVPEARAPRDDVPQTMPT